MKIEFYFDPICPFSWITSRWLHRVSNDRTIDIDWKPFSLAIKNREKHRQNPSKHQEAHESSLRVLRVIQAAKEKHNTDPGVLYTEFGMPFHLTDRPYTDDLIANGLNQQSLPADLIEAADDSTYDKALEASIQSAIEVVGKDIGVPTIVFVAKDSSRTGYYGPVLDALPEKDEALKLWDGLSALATNKSFYELKRSRQGGGPNVSSTAAC